METVKKETQVERIGNALIAIKVNVTKDDRKAYVEQTKRTEQIIVRYLKGEVRNTTIGLEMLEFFQNCIAERDVKINETINQTVNQ